MTILGVDPGLTVTGWAVLHHKDPDLVLKECGKIVPRPKDSAADRLAFIHRQLRDVLMKHQPHTLALEKAFVHKNPLSALTLGQVRGVIMLTASLCQVPVVEYAPTLVKQSFTGYGHASKQQIIEMAYHLFRVDVSADTADAIALAFCHEVKQNFESKMRLLTSKS